MLVKNFIRILGDIQQCNSCAKKVELSKIIPCDICSIIIYCSDKCKSEDIKHSDYHKKSSLPYKKMNLDEIAKYDINNFLENTSKKGRIGLKNFGNSCFINSAIQCLSNCEDLTKYFLSKSFVEDINKIRGLSIDGRIARMYYDLLYELWIGQSTVVSPTEFKNMFMSFVKQYPGVNHFDVKDMILFVLDHLHEDLNQVKERLEVNITEQNKNETDESASTRWWEALQKRENSIVVDLFYGQFKNQVRCPSCKTTNITYDPFNIISLPIPDSNISKIRFKVFLNNSDYKYVNVEIFDVNKTTKVKYLKTKVKEAFRKSKEFDCLLLKNKAINELLSDEDLVYDHVFTRVDFSDEVFVDTEIIFCEVENSFNSKNKGDFVTFFVNPAEIFEESYYFIMKTKKFTALSYPKAFSMSKKMRIKDLYMEIYKYYRRAMNDMVTYIKNEGEETEADTSYYETFYSNVNDKDFVEKDFDKLFLKLGESGENERDGFNKYEINKASLFQIYLVNNIPTPSSYLSRKQSCEYCKTNCQLCRFILNLSTKIYEYYAMQIVTRPFILAVEFQKFKTGFYKYYEEFIDFKDAKINFRGELTLYDCLDHFRKEEKFEKEKPWYCDNCQRGVEAFKKSEIYLAPKFLIIQLKRFKLKGHKSLMELVNNKKNETLVFFPIDNFEISNCILSDKNNSNYHLVSVCQHTGGLQGGHFTTIARNGNEWLEYDDDKVNPISTDKIITEKAYMLIYRRTETFNYEDMQSNSINDCN